MTKASKVFTLLFLFTLIATIMTACSKPPEYAAVSGFYYSGDKGHTYGDGIKEYAVGESVYMKVKYRVTSDKNKISQVKVVLMIPKIQSVDARYMDGQVITPSYDAIRNVTTYEFTANASKNALEAECVFQFIPNAAGSITMTLIYDDNVDMSYDQQSTLIFVDSIKPTGNPA